MADRWTKIPDEKELNETADAIKLRGINVIIVDNKSEVLEKIKNMIPKGSSVANGSSTTLIEVGFVDYLMKGSHGWKNLHEEALKEKDQTKQVDLRRKMDTADFF